MPIKPSSPEQLVAAIHASPTKLVIASSGGGARAIATLLEVPGASRTVLEAVVPYSPEALTDWLGGPPDRFCSEETARAMAVAGLLRACRLTPSGGEPLAAVACTASLASDRPKRGAHRAHLAIQTPELTAARSIRLEKGRRSRFEEEQLVGHLVLSAAAEACGLPERLPVDLLRSERIDEHRAVAPPSWRGLLLGHVEAVRHGSPEDPAEPAAPAIFPGAFHPLHSGHRRMAEIARELLSVPVQFELSIVNPDKPPLDYYEIERRTGQFDAGQTLWLTRAPTFRQKSRQFPGATFLVGSDTLRRIADPSYYGHDRAACRAALETIAAAGCGFLVFGRVVEASRFVTLADLDLPAVLRSICREVPVEQFREDVSSTEIRRAKRE